jgi:hypothetical protein
VFTIGDDMTVPDFATQTRRASRASEALACASGLCGEIVHADTVMVQMRKVGRSSSQMLAFARFSFL